MKSSERPDIEQIVFEEHRIESNTAGISLYLRNKHPRTMTSFSAERTIVMVHGATYSSGSLYDVRLGGFSFMDYLAAKGYDVFAVDVRGYGLSTRPKTLEEDPRLNPPSVGTDVGVSDFSSAVNFVLKHRGLERVNVFAMSWGGTVAGAYAVANPSKVRKLSLLAPQWLSDKPIPLDTGGELVCYRLVPVFETLPRWLGTAPKHHADSLIPAGWFEQWARATLAEDPWSEDRARDRLRATNGPIEDIRKYWRAGKPYYEPSAITVPVLLLHGEWDIDVPIELSLQYFRELRSAPYRRWIEIGEATHMALLEKNRMQAFRAITDFLSEDYEPE
ncbi:alpha/beta hydrolase [Bradyrhizobium cenepequi]|uniref:alpha/beta hydrolase n=1 Tax=Bradyrhizobium cenepequi TaxID=2821403 RepID=UPI001CE2A97C|nr:alpha/beta hydrolase [Bradyrhizobium cenepequi]MCA6106828.1 alpha/beta hydrolase [Bradyrhizobium cenepequi]